jgi:hypothetical protein
MRKLIKTNGESIDLPGPVTVAEICELIGAKTLDSVMLRHLGYPLKVMLMDDEAHETAMFEHGDGSFELRSVGHRKPVNEEATRLYHANCLPGTTHQILGDVVVVPDHDFEE